MARTSLPEGTLLHGQHRIVRVLGQGGFGVTYLAQNENLDVEEALKEYFPIGLADRTAEGQVVPNPEARETFDWGRTRFSEEARLLARLDHPNIVPVTHIFEENGTAYMVLPYETGQSLRRWATRLRRPPNQGELDALVDELLSALEYLHDARLLHRDIAPDNIIVRPDGSPVLIDFGAARRLVDARGQGMTAIVKSGYSPPESYVTTPGVAGPWTDIYALAASLYQVVTGQAPPDATRRQLEDDLKPTAGGARDRYRPQFLEAIDWGLELYPKNRPQSVAEWRKRMLPARPGPALQRSVPLPSPQSSPGRHTPEDDVPAGAETRMAATPPSSELLAALPRSHGPGDDRDTRGGRDRSEPGLMGLVTSGPLDRGVVALCLAGMGGILATVAVRQLAGFEGGHPINLARSLATLTVMAATTVGLALHNWRYIAGQRGATAGIGAAGRRMTTKNLVLLGLAAMALVVTAPLALVCSLLAVAVRRSTTAVAFFLTGIGLVGLIVLGVALAAKLPQLPAGTLAAVGLLDAMVWPLAAFSIVAGTAPLLALAVYASRAAARRAEKGL